MGMVRFSIRMVVIGKLGEKLNFFVVVACFNLVKRS